MSVKGLHSLSFALENLTDEARATIEDHTVIVRNQYTGRKRRKFDHHTIEIDGVRNPRDKYYHLTTVCNELKSRFPSFNHTQLIWGDIGD